MGIFKNTAYAPIIDIDETSSTIFTYLMGKFPITSNRGYKHILVLYDYNSNAILVEPLKSRTGP